jgi:hypothetical protein
MDGNGTEGQTADYLSPDEGKPDTHFLSTLSCCLCSRTQSPHPTSTLAPQVLGPPGHQPHLPLIQSICSGRRGQGWGMGHCPGRLDQSRCRKGAHRWHKKRISDPYGQLRLPKETLLATYHPHDTTYIIWPLGVPIYNLG